MNDLIDHAKREFRALGYEPVETAPDDGDKLMQECILELLRVFSGQRHSGASAKYCIQAFTKLADFQSLTDDEEKSHD